MDLDKEDRAMYISIIANLVDAIVNKGRLSMGVLDYMEDFLDEFDNKEELNNVKKYARDYLDHQLAYYNNHIH